MSRNRARAALKLQPSAEAHLHLSYLSTEAEERERHVRAALQLTPRSPDIYLRLAQLFGEDKAAPPRKAEAEAAFRELVQLDPIMGGQRLFNFLRFEERKLEAAVAFRGAKLLVEERRQAEAAAAEDEAACAEELRFSITLRAAHRLKVNAAQGKYASFNGKIWETHDLPQPAVDVD